MSCCVRRRHPALPARRPAAPPQPAPTAINNALEYSGAQPTVTVPARRPYSALCWRGLCRPGLALLPPPPQSKKSRAPMHRCAGGSNSPWPPASARRACSDPMLRHLTPSRRHDGDEVLLAVSSGLIAPLCMPPPRLPSPITQPPGSPGLPAGRQPWPRRRPPRQSPSDRSGGVSTTQGPRPVRD